jgi:hypothetical protein
MSLPTEVPIISDAELALLEQCFEVRDQYLYFHRIKNPNRATVYHGIRLLNEHLIETGFKTILFDFTDRDMVEHAHMRYLVEQVKASEPMKGVEHFIMVLDGNAFRRIAANFFLNVFYRNRETQIHMCQVREEAEHLAEQVAGNSRQSDV